MPSVIDGASTAVSRDVIYSATAAPAAEGAESSDKPGSHPVDQRSRDVGAAVALLDGLTSFYKKIPGVRTQEEKSPAQNSADAQGSSGMFEPFDLVRRTAFQKAPITPVSQTVASKAIDAMLNRLASALQNQIIADEGVEDLQLLLSMPRSSSHADIKKALVQSVSQTDQTSRSKLVSGIVSDPKKMAAALNIIQSEAFAKALGLNDRLHYRVGALAGQSLADDPAFSAFTTLFSGIPLKLQAKQTVQLDEVGSAEPWGTIDLPPGLETLEDLLTHFQIDPSTKSTRACLLTHIEFLPVDADGNSASTSQSPAKSFPGRQLKIMFHSGFNEIPAVKQTKSELRQPLPTRTLAFSPDLTAPEVYSALANGGGDASNFLLSVDCLTPPHFPDGDNKYRNDTPMHALLTWLNEPASSKGLIHLCGRHFPKALVDLSVPDGQAERPVARVATIPDGADESPGNHRLQDTEYMAMSAVKKLSDYFMREYGLNSPPVVNLSMFSTFAPCLSCNQGMLLSMFDGDNYPDMKLNYWATDNRRAIEVFKSTVEQHTT